MAWVNTSQTQTVKGLVVKTETILLGGTAGLRYSSAFQVPPGVDFTIISNAAATNTSGSLSDAMYGCDTESGTYIVITDDLRWTSGKVTQGTSFRDLDTLARARVWRTNEKGSWPWYKLAVDHAAVESTGKTIKFIVSYDGNAKSIANVGSS